MSNYFVAKAVTNGSLKLSPGRIMEIVTKVNVISCSHSLSLPLPICQRGHVASISQLALFVSFKLPNIPEYSNFLII